MRNGCEQKRTDKERGAGNSLHIGKPLDAVGVRWTGKEPVCEKKEKKWHE